MAGEGCLRAANRLRLFLAAAGWVAVVVRGPAAGQEVPASAATSQVPDSVHGYLADGRFWKASLILRDILAPLESASRSDRLLLAEAEAGWKNWDGAAAALSAEGIDTAQAPPRLWYLLGSARLASGDKGGAGAAFRRFVAGSPEGRSPEALTALSLLVRLLADDGLHDEAVTTLARLADRSPTVADWTALDVGYKLAEAGEAEALGRFLALVADSTALLTGWSLEPDAWAAAGDTARALEALRSARLPQATAAVHADRLGREWRYLLALGDSAGAVDAMESLLQQTTAGTEALAAARAHWRVARDSGPEILGLVAAAFGRGAEFGLAVRARRVAARRGAVLTETERLALARAYNGSSDRGSAVEVYRELSSSEDPSVGAAALSSWASIRTRQGRHQDARILQERLLERYPSSSEAVDIVFFRADDHRSAGRLNQAIEQYRLTASLRPTSDRAGLARMRWAQIHLARGEARKSAEVFRNYLEDFPRGRRWEEASYWAIHAAREAGDTTGSGDLSARLLRESPLSYYAYLAAETPGSAVAFPFGSAAAFPFEQNPGPSSPPPRWLARELQLVEALDDAGLDEGADALVADLKAAVSDSTELTLALARALNEGGRTIDGIRLGWELRERGEEWTRALLEVVYPFPYRALVTSRAEELGLDPYLVAGLIRQESAFVPTISSSAGAIGLMQVMPATGRQLARAVGPRGYRTESLRTAEVNIHLGTRYLAELTARYDGAVLLVLSAYNAGPTRADRWRRFPEAEDPRRFTERIPFVETRGYVKNVVRNRALYRWLYGAEGTVE